MTDSPPHDNSMSQGFLLDIHEAAPSEVISGSLTSITVPVIVGKDVCPTPRTFHLHSALLMQNSHYFAAALKKDAFTEGREWRIELPDIQPAVFSVFVEILYRITLDPSTAVIWSADERIVPTLLEAYALGERLICPRVKAAAEKTFAALLDAYRLKLTEGAVCKLLEIGSTKLHTFPDDPVSSRIMDLALERLTVLQGFDGFKALLHEHTNVAIHIALQAKPKESMSAVSTSSLKPRRSGW